MKRLLLIPPELNVTRFITLKRVGTQRNVGNSLDLLEEILRDAPPENTNLFYEEIIIHFFSFFILF